jgi:signal transduction histidine kinase
VSWAALGLLSVAIALTTIGLVIQMSIGVYATPIAFQLTQSAAILANSIVGLVIVRRRPRHPIGWILLAFGLNWGVRQALFGYAAQGIATLGAGAAPAIAAVVYWADTPTDLVLITWFCVLFPDGRAMSARWGSLRWTALFSAVYLFVATLLKPGPLHGFESVNNPIGSEAIGGILDALSLPPSVLLLLSFFGGATSLPIRLRRSASAERQQIKWVAWAGFLYAVSFGIFIFAPEAFAAVAFSGVALTTVVAAVAIYFAVLRYRLYDIDLLISRTIIYGGIAAFVTLSYGITIAATGSLVGQTAGMGPIVTLVAIAIIALLLEPVRARLNTLANVAVFGKRASPYEVLSEFARSVGAAESAEVLLPRMARLVGDGAGSAVVEVWVRVGERLRLAAASPESPARETLADESDLATRAGAAGTIVPVFEDAEQLGALVVRKPRGERLDPTEDRLVNDLAAQAGLVFSRFRLFEELRESRARIMTAQDRERRRIERDLHDGAQQRFVNAILNLGLAQQLIAASTSQASDLLQQATREMQAGLSELRALAHGLHPPLLSEAGLHAAIASLADRSPIHTSVIGVPERRYAEPVEVTAYFVVAEALANAAKHSHASVIQIRIDDEGGRLRVEVSDDGVGGVDPRRGSGIVGLQDRAAAAGGSLAVESRNGHGTVVRVDLPYA